MECKKVIEILEKQSPKSYACDWDNVGLLVGREDKEIQKIYIALDATDEAIEEAIANGADMLLTHHPMIFKGMKRVTQEDFIGRRIIRLIQNDMVYYAMHTNFDVMGMADLAADYLGISDTRTKSKDRSHFTGFRKKCDLECIAGRGRCTDHRRY